MVKEDQSKIYGKVAFFLESPPENEMQTYEETVYPIAVLNLEMPAYSEALARQTCLWNSFL